MSIAGLEGDDPSVAWTFSGAADYMSRIEANKPVANYAYLCPHGNIRMEVMGIEARPATEEELCRIEQVLRRELAFRLAMAGVAVDDARLTHLAYAPEIAQSMLRRQQADAIIAARGKIVRGAVDMVEMALGELSERHVVDMDEDRRAAMVSNLLVVLCGDSEAQPVVNTGTIYQ